jgi:hypothetical protein
MKRNIIKVINIDNLLDYDSSDSYYKSPFEILAELDNKAKFIDIDKIQDVLLIEYKPDGHAIFNFAYANELGNKITLNFEFTGFVS